MNIKNLCRVCDSTYTKEDAIAEVEKVCNAIKEYKIDYNPEIPKSVLDHIDNSVYGTYEGLEPLAKELFRSTKVSKRVKDKLLAQIWKRMLPMIFQSCFDKYIGYSINTEGSFDKVKNSLIKYIQNSKDFDPDEFISRAEKGLSEQLEGEKEYWENTLNRELPENNANLMIDTWDDCIEKAAETLEGEVAKDVDIDINDVDW